MDHLTIRQEEMINAAISLIAAKGIQELSIRNLADEVGVSEPAIYRHFKNKKDLLIKMVFYIGHDRKQALQKFHLPEKITVQALGMILTKMMEYFQSNEKLTTVMFLPGLFQDDQNLSREMYEVTEYGLNLLRDVIQDAQTGGGIREDIDSMQLAVIISGMIRSILIRWIQNGYNFKLTEEWNKAWNTMEALVKG